ncbi:MAG: ecotin family protein, partial [Desulfoferrobacter sp.]
MQSWSPRRQTAWQLFLQLTKMDDESLFEVELIVGKTVLIDARNSYFFGGKIEEETIQGWGFPRYNVNKLGPM